MQFVLYAGKHNYNNNIIIIFIYYFTRDGWNLYGLVGGQLTIGRALEELLKCKRKLFISLRYINISTINKKLRTC